jgi:hypothetical protein
MPSRINHVKIVTPEPAVVDAFLREVCDVPEGWPLSADATPHPAGAPLGPGGDLPDGEIDRRRPVTGPSGFITGDSSSRQVQILEGGPAAIWAMCVSTRDIEGVYERAKARGVPCSPVTVADWNERDNIRNFFCVVAGVMFEIIRVEPKAP